MASKATRGKVNLRLFSRVCTTHKMTYDTKAEALDGAERAMESDHVSPGCHITPYLCPECHRWHLFNRQIVPVPGNAFCRHRRRTDLE